MTKIYSLDKLQKARLMRKDLEKLVHVLQLNLSGLSQYKKYKDIGLLLDNILDTKTLLEIHLNSINRFIDSKGLVNDQFKD